MKDETITFAALSRQFATAVEAGRTASRQVPFIALQYTALMAHKVETDEDKRLLTAQAADLAATWLSRISALDYKGQYVGATAAFSPLFDALQAPGAMPFIPATTATQLAEAAVAFAMNGPALLQQAGPHEKTDDTEKLKAQNRAELLALTSRVLDFTTKLKEFSENLNLEAKTSKDIAPVKQITLKSKPAEI